MKSKNKSFQRTCFFLYVLVFGCAVSYNNVTAQPLPSSKSAGTASQAVVFIAARQQLPGLIAGKYETRYATGFLISDRKKIYLVTSKHSIQNKVVGQQSTLICDSLFISSSTAAKLNTIGFIPSPDSKPNTGDYIFSDDKDDLAIVSMQNSRFNMLLKSLISKSCRPITLAVFRNDQVIQPTDTVFHSSYMVFNHRELGLAYVQTGGLTIAGTYNDGKNSFLLNTHLPSISEGSPVVVKEKLAGVIVDAGKQVNVTKSSVILGLLRKLQSMENK